ncbi:MAG: hypothetical protein ACLRW6_09090 [Clostridia bacterium]
MWRNWFWGAVQEVALSIISTVLCKAISKRASCSFAQMALTIWMNCCPTFNLRTV